MKEYHMYVCLSTATGAMGGGEHPSAAPRLQPSKLLQSLQ